MGCGSRKKEFCGFGKNFSGSRRVVARGFGIARGRPRGARGLFPAALSGTHSQWLGTGCPRVCPVPPAFYPLRRQPPSHTRSATRAGEAACAPRTRLVPRVKPRFTTPGALYPLLRAERVFGAVPKLQWSSLVEWRPLWAALAMPLISASSFRSLRPSAKREERSKEIWAGFWGG